MKKVAVTGASGHIGANLVRELLSRGYEVVALVRQSTRALDGLDIEQVQGDVQDLQSLCRAFSGVEQVFHLAAFISIGQDDGEKLQAVNVQGTANVLDACQSEGVSTLIHFSTIHALEQHPLGKEVNEDNPLINRAANRGGGYEHSKARADRLVRENSCRSLSTRTVYPTGVIGPNDFSHSLIGQAIRRMSKGCLPALVAGGYDWVDARDVAWGAIEAAEKGAGGDRYILSGHYMSMSEVAAVIEALTGVAAPRFTSPLWLARLGAPLMGLWDRIHGEESLYTRDSLSALSSNKVISHARATEKLGYQPRPFHRSVHDALTHYAALGET